MLLPQHEIRALHGILLRLIERQDLCGTTPDLVRENGFSSINQKERGLASRLGRSCRIDHNIDWSSSYQLLPQASSFFLKVLALRPLRTSALARSSWPLLRGCATEA